MRERSRDKGRLEDILFYANNVTTILEGVSYEEFVKDIRIYYSVMKNVEIIGEAANMLSKDFIETYHDIPWKPIIGMRHVLVHGYAQVSTIALIQAFIPWLSPPLHKTAILFILSFLLLLQNS